MGPGLGKLDGEFQATYMGREHGTGILGHSWWIKSRAAQGYTGAFVGNCRNNTKATEIESFPAEVPR